ncbi:Transferase [Melia azedarach]|uniref:Transferase n=2 Tax=Melia azedarach TaxID=155640 RepID=A0ACC1Y657_MELAZ|nr:Transferase [Melia azedarach]KAJ4718863.1 Transferase [Melia azedarach]
MEIKILSIEIIKPSSPTPAHLRNHKPFLPSDVGFGQVKDGVFDCNDHGAIFIETQVVGDQMSKLVQKRDNNLFKQLLPLKGNTQEISTTYSKANLVVQINYFSCGGIAITICYNHILVDGTTAAYFVKSWAEIAHGANGIKDVVVDCSSIYTPYDAHASVISLYEQNPWDYSPTELVGKHFIFDGGKIAALREKIGSGPYLNHLTRFEAIAAFISGVLIKNADRGTHEFTSKQIAAVIAINLRNKVNPPLPPQTLGCLVTTAIAKLPINEEIDYNYIAAEVHKAVKNVVDQYKNNMHVDGLVKGLENSAVIHFSDISRMPFYEADFGWGKPILVSLVSLNVKAGCLLPTSDGVGVEAFIVLTKEEIAKFEQDPEFLSYAKPFVSKRAKL